MSSILLGQGLHGDVNIDVDVLLRSGLLVQANSGGGKSRTFRRLAEQLCPLVPTFIIDPEGEFATLRERFPFVLVRREDGDVTADVATAGALAHKLLDLGVSAVFDLFDMPFDERHAWVAAFLEAMDQAPKHLWRDVALLVDEAHVYAPEKGKGESIALGPMAALASRGRKRGWGPIMATQRVAKFNKDVASELKNILVGLTWIANDRSRAREDLGVDRPERREIDNQLRFMKPGNFFALGRVFGATERITVHVGSVVSSHPDPDSRKRPLQPPPAPAKIRAILAKLSNLPSAAPAAASANVAQLQAEVARLRRELAAAPTVAPQIERVPFIPPRVGTGLAETENELTAALDRIRSLRQLEHDLSSPGQAPTPSDPPVPRRADVKSTRPKEPRPLPPSGAPGAAPTDHSNGVPRLQVPSLAGQAPAAAALTRGAREILAVLRAHHPTPLSKLRIANICVMEPKGSTLRTYLGHLKTARFVVGREDDSFGLTDQGVAAAGTTAFIPGSRGLVERWQKKLTGKAKDMLLVFAEEARALTKAEVGERLRLEPNGHTFRTYLGHLQTAGVVRKTSGGFIVSSDLAIS